MGTGGAVWAALGLCREERALVLNGDTYFDVDFAAFARQHEKNHADCTIALKQMERFDRYGAVELDKERIVAFREKAPVARGTINGGVYMLETNLPMRYPMTEKFSLEADFLTAKLQELRLFGAVDCGNFIDIGIPEDYSAAQTFLPEWVRP